MTSPCNISGGHKTTLFAAKSAGKRAEEFQVRLNPGESMRLPKPSKGQGGHTMGRKSFAIPAVLLGSLQLITLGLPAPAQDPPGSSPPLPGECTALDPNIAIDVEVTDKLGRPVLGLETANFKLFDNGRQQKILSFRVVDKAHPPDVPLAVRIVIDAVNSDPILVARERDGLSAFLAQTSGKLDHPTSIWILENSGLTQVAGPSQDIASLLTSLHEMQPRLGIVNRSSGVWGDVERTGQAIRLLKQEVAPDTRTPGRKLILFLSPGWPLLLNYEPDSRRPVFADIVTLSNGLRQSCISLYTLDPFSSGTPIQPRNFGSISSAYDAFLKPPRKIADAHYGDLSLQVLSEHSGGQVLTTSNDIKAELNSALRGASSWYRLVFPRASGARANEYHALRVAVDKPGVKIRTTAGYYLSGP